MKKIEEIQEIAKACLQDGNRIELKVLGLALIQNLLSQNPMLQIPFEIFQAAIDFSHFSANRAVQLADRHILNNMKEPPWMSNINELVNRVTPSQQQQLTKISMHIPPQELAKEMIVLFKELLEFTMQGGITSSGVNLPEHFKKWLGILKKSYLLMLYPDLSEENLRIGFTQCPDILHYIVVSWINKLISIPEIFIDSFSNEGNRKYLLRVLEKSFIWLNSDDNLSRKCTVISLKIFKNWLIAGGQILKDISNENFHLMIVEHLALIFDYKNDITKKRIDICIEAISLFDKHQTSSKSKTRILKNLLSISDILNNQEKIKDIIEPFSFFVIKVLRETYETSSKDFICFSKYLHGWADNFFSIIHEWKKTILELSSLYTPEDFSDRNKISSLLEFFKILGNPLELSEESQGEWAMSLHEAISNLLEMGISRVLLIKYFLQDLSVLILGGNEVTQNICMNSACILFTKGSLTSPSQLHIQHLFYLLSISIKKKHLEITILKHCARLLDYNGMHVLIKPLINIAKESRSPGIQVILRILSLPNYYGATELLSLDSSKSDYLSLKREIFQFFVESLSNGISQQALDGLAVFLTEEIVSGCNEYIEKGLDLILTECMNIHNNTEIPGLKALSVLVPLLPQFHQKIMDVLVRKVFEPARFDREQLMINILNFTMCVLMNFKTNLNEETMKVLFQRVAKFSSDKNIEPKLRAYMDVFLSFIGFFYLNFPLKGGSVEIIDSNFQSSILDTEGEHFTLNGNMIITLLHDKFMIRNEFGKYLWNCMSFQIFDSYNYSEEREQLLKILSSSRLSLVSQPSPAPLEENPTLELLIDFIKDNYETSYESQAPDCPEITKKIESIEKLEASSVFEEHQVDEKKFEQVKNLSKIFIANIGLLDRLEPLLPGEKLSRSLNILDAIKPREQVKIAVLYVNPGQDDEKEILANNCCSEGFKEFLNKLGRLVELESYLGNMGSLDPKGSSGRHSIVYSDWEFDVMFHVPVLMPTDINNDQQLLKKKHVGNDNVVIIWSENWKDYRQETLLTHFNFVNIVIYPLEKLMYRIQIFNKAGVEFGPLKDGMVVSWKILPYLSEDYCYKC